MTRPESAPEREKRHESIRRRVQDGDLFAGAERACRRIRLNAGLTLTALAEKMEVSKSSVSQFEYSSGPKQTDTLGRYIHCCGATLDDFFRVLAKVQHRQPPSHRGEEMDAAALEEAGEELRRMEAAVHALAKRMVDQMRKAEQHEMELRRHEEALETMLALVGGMGGRKTTEEKKDSDRLELESLLQRLRE